MKDINKFHYYCPRCKSFSIWELDHRVYCPICVLTFDKSAFHKFLDEDLLAIEELNGLIKLIDEEGLDFKLIFE